jgi:hypothetical protein
MNSESESLQRILRSVVSELMVHESSAQTITNYVEDAIEHVLKSDIRDLTLQLIILNDRQTDESKRWINDHPNADLVEREEDQQELDNDRNIIIKQVGNLASLAYSLLKQKKKFLKPENFKEYDKESIVNLLIQNYNLNLSINNDDEERYQHIMRSLLANGDFGLPSKIRPAENSSTEFDNGDDIPF